MYQTNEKLHPKIQKYGCGILCCLYLTGKEWSVEDVNSLYERALSKRVIDEDCFINWNNFLKILGNLEFVKFEESEYLCGRGEYEIQRFFNPRTGIRHFVVGNEKNGKTVKYDPYPNSTTVKEGYLESKRILRRVLI